mgnify:CR=1 FL=1
MAKNIQIYDGAVRRLYAEGIHLEKEQIIPFVRKEIIRESSLYYSSFGNFINMEYDLLLPTEEEAMDYLNHIIDNRYNMIVDYFTDLKKYSNEERQALLHMISSLSSCVYYDSSDVHPLMEIPKKDFKELRKALILERKNKDIR